MNKLIIIGIDALDYNLVNKWNLENLMQLEHNKMKIPIWEEYNCGESAQVWGALLTGKVLDIHIKHPKRKRESLLKIMKWVKKIFPFISTGINTKISPLSKSKSFPDLNEETFIDNSDIKYFNVPFYDFCNTSFNILFKMGINKITLNECVNMLDDLLMSKLNTITDIIREGDYNVFFGYTHAFDSLQHMLFTKENELKKRYEVADNYIGEIQKILNDEILVVISDHGFNVSKGIHSDYAFYSCNKEIRPRPESIFDIRDLIINTNKYYEELKFAKS